MPYHNHNPVITKEYYLIGAIAKEAACSTNWVRQLCIDFGIEVKKVESGRFRNEMRFTPEQKDEVIKLRWLMKDAKKCVEYCWKNGVKP